MINTALPVLISHIANDNRIIPQMMVFVYRLYIFLCILRYLHYAFLMKTAVYLTVIRILRPNSIK